jgi:hypothetical protein
MPFFLAAPAAGEETNPTSTGHAQTPAPLGVLPRAAFCGVLFILRHRLCTEFDQHPLAHLRGLAVAQPSLSELPSRKSQGPEVHLVLARSNKSS